jgi:hypothetical protein
MMPAARIQLLVSRLNRNDLVEIPHQAEECLKLHPHTSKPAPTSIRYRSSFIFLQTIAVLPLLESIFAVKGMQAQVTVLAFPPLPQRNAQ